MPAIALGVPAYRSTVNVCHVVQSVQLSQWATKAGIQFYFSWADTCSLDWARNTLIHWATHKAESNWLLMCDADTYHVQSKAGPAVQDIARMLEEGTKRGAAVIGAPVHCRGEGGWNCQWIREGDEVILQEADFAGQVVEVDRIGTAFMAVNCDWVRACWPQGPWVQSRQVMTPKGPGWLGEDFAFCDGVKQARGGLILADGRFSPAHISHSMEASALLNLGQVLTNG